MEWQEGSSLTSSIDIPKGSCDTENPVDCIEDKILYNHQKSCVYVTLEEHSLLALPDVISLELIKRNIVPWCSQCPVRLWRLAQRWSGSVSYPLCNSLFPKQKLLGGIENDCGTLYNIGCLYNYPNKPKGMVKKCRSNVRMRERNEGKRKVNKK